MKEFVEKLIERLEEYKYSHLIEHDSERSEHCEENDSDYCQGTDCFLCVWNKATEIVKDLAEEHNNGWIPCSERLPEKKKEVLIFADDNAIFVGHLMNGGFIVHDGDGWIDLKFILAWQPLPAPYKKGE